MINRELLAKATKSTVIVSYFIPLVLVPLILVAWILASEPGSATPAFALGDLGMLGFVVVTLIALSPLVLRPLVRKGLASVRRRAAEHPELMAAKPEIFIPMHAQLSHLVWDVSALAGFVAFILGFGWAYFAAATVIALTGFVVDFPKRDAILGWADEYDAEVGRSHPPTAL